MSHKNAVEKTKQSRSRRGSKVTTAFPSFLTKNSKTFPCWSRSPYSYLPKLFTAFPLIEQKERDSKDLKSDGKDLKDAKDSKDKDVKVRRSALRRSFRSPSLISLDESSSERGGEGGGESTTKISFEHRYDISQLVSIASIFCSIQSFFSPYIEPRICEKRAYCDRSSKSFGLLFVENQEEINDSEQYGRTSCYYTRTCYFYTLEARQRCLADAGSSSEGIVT